MKILLMGPRINKNNSLLTGGAIAAFDNLIHFCQYNGVSYQVIDTNKKNYKNIIIAYISIVYQLVVKQNKSTHISLHSSKDYIFLSIFIIFIGRVFKKKTSLRKFGGDALEVYENSSWIQRKWLEGIYKNIDILFFEIKYIVESFRKINQSTFWYPNTRDRVNNLNLERKYTKKFVFIGHVHKDKGIDEILSASKYLDDSYTIDIYGPITDKKYNKDFFLSYNITYHGALKSDDVIANLKKYDVLVLPSYKEGYPGVIIEAYSLGIPIISTKLRNIEELVDGYKTGILIHPGNVEELLQAIHFFNETNYIEFVQNAYKKFDIFDSTLQTKIFLERLENE